MGAHARVAAAWPRRSAGVIVAAIPRGCTMSCGNPVDALLSSMQCPVGVPNKCPHAAGGGDNLRQVTLFVCRHSSHHDQAPVFWEWVGGWGEQDPRLESAPARSGIARDLRGDCAERVGLGSPHNLPAIPTQSPRNHRAIPAQSQCNPRAIPVADPLHP